MLADEDPTDQASQRYSEAAGVHGLAARLDSVDARYPLAIARSLRKRATRWPRAPNARDDLRQALQHLENAAALDPTFAEVENERGEVHLSLGDVVEARRRFAQAVALGAGSGGEANQYRYYCNQANAHTRDPAAEEDFQKALDAADKAIALRPDHAVEGHYYRGLALWRLDDTAAAVEAFNRTSAHDATHVGALLARSQIAFESQDPPPTREQLQRARQDVDTALQLLQETPATNHDKAKAYYVRSLAWLKQHVDTRSEESLVRCQQDLVTSLEFAPDYANSAKRLFDYAADFDWQREESRQESQRLREAFQSLLGRSTQTVRQ
jgi:tetratricopeptide (TPR) repeat protein